MFDEQDLIRQCILGDEDAFAELIDRYKVMVFNIADRMVHDSEITEDLAQGGIHQGKPRSPGIQGKRETIDLDLSKLRIESA